MRIIGIHPVEAPEPCHLFEVEADEPVDWGRVTQEVDGQPQSNWQVPWDEQQVGENRWVFFFHYLQLDRPLLTDSGAVELTAETPMPDRLANINYESPC